MTRHLAVGDIHGSFTALAALAAAVPFRPEDTLITLGDYVDRGPDTHRVLDWLIAYQKKGRLVALRGNHELMMLQACEDEGHLGEWLACGGDATLASYSPFGDAGRLVDVPDAHWRFLDETIPHHEIGSHFFVHAGVMADMPLAEQPDFMLYWEKFDDPPAHESGKVMVCGHTAQRSGLPKSVGHAVCIDTAACKGGWLTCLDVGTGRYWQADQKGRTRTAWLGE